MSTNPQSISEFLSKHLASYFAIHKGETPNAGLYNIVLSEVEKITIVETLKYTGGVQAKAAQILGISRNTLRKKMNEYGVS
jgi:two-component system nitrogen regulation response regulator GlnG